MRISRGLHSYAPDSHPAVVALGAFDGVHLAHQRILEVAVQRAREVGARAVVCTFDPHPLAVLRPRDPPEPLCTLQERLERIAAAGIDVAVVIPFTLELASVEPEDFVREALVDRLRAGEVVVGFNHTFGRGARGTPALLESWGQTLGFVTHVVPALSVGGVVVSSSTIREALRGGDVARARTLLGRPYSIRGPVVRGAGRGRQLGFPTANVSTERPPLVPAGVYAGYSRIEPPLASEATAPGSPRAPANRYRSVLNIGFRPTFDTREFAIEVHLLDIEADLYGRGIAVELVERIRDERRFADIEALRAQIRHDVGVAASSL